MLALLHSQHRFGLVQGHHRRRTRLSACCLVTAGLCERGWLHTRRQSQASFVSGPLSIFVDSLAGGVALGSLRGACGHGSLWFVGLCPGLEGGIAPGAPCHLLSIATYALLL